MKNALRLLLCLAPWTLWAAMDTVVNDSPEVTAAYAKMGDPSAQYNLAVTLENGAGGMRADRAAALVWYQRAAEAGFAMAEFNLGVRLSTGDGVAKDEKQAFKWFQAAALQGNFRAQKALLRCYVLGVGVEKNAIKALHWSFLARRTLEMQSGTPAGAPPKPARLRPDGLAEYDTPTGREAMGEDGHVEKIAADGTRLLSFLDGSRGEISIAGDRQRFFQDGTVLREFPDGRKVTIDPRGTTETRLPDGTRTVEGEVINKQGEKARSITTFDKDGKTLLQRMKVRGQWVEKRPDGSLFIEVEALDEASRPVRIIDSIAAKGGPPVRRIVRLEDGLERVDEQEWLLTFWKELDDGRRVRMREKFGLHGAVFGSEVLETQPPIEAAKKPPLIVKVPAKVPEPLKAGVPATPPPKEAASRSARKVAPATNSDLFRQPEPIEPQLAELAQIEKRSRYFAGATEAQYEEARVAARGFVFALPNAPQKSQPAVGLKLSAIAVPPPPAPLREIPTDLADVHPLGHFGRLAIRQYPWKHAETEHFVVHFRESSDANPVMKHIEEVLFLVTQTLQVDPSKWQRKSHVFVFPNRAVWTNFAQANGMSPSVSGFAYKDELLFGAPDEKDDFLRLLSHETTHAVVARIYPGRTWPLWMNEGFAEHMAAVAAVLSTSKFRTIPKRPLVGPFAVTPVFERIKYGMDRLGVSDVGLFYLQSEKCVRTVLEQLPAKEFPRFANLLMAGNPPPVALKEAYGAACPDARAFERLLNMGR